MTPSICIDDQQVQEALQSDAVARRIMEKNKFPAKGQRIGVRLNLNVLKNTGVAVQTLHEATNTHGYTKNKGFYNGEAIGYAAAVTLKNAYFNVEQSARQAIACGQQAKSPMASVDGQFVEALTNVDLAEQNPTEIRFNPKAVHLFVDNENRAIRKAEYVTIVGHRAYAWGDIEYHTSLTAPLKMGDAPSAAMLQETARPDKSPEKTNHFANIAATTASMLTALM